MKGLSAGNSNLYTLVNQERLTGKNEERDASEVWELLRLRKAASEEDVSRTEGSTVSSSA